MSRSSQSPPSSPSSPAKMAGPSSVGAEEFLRCVADPSAPLPSAPPPPGAVVFIDGTDGSAVFVAAVYERADLLALWGEGGDAWTTAAAEALRRLLPMQRWRACAAILRAAPAVAMASMGGGRALHAACTVQRPPRKLIKALCVEMKRQGGDANVPDVAGNTALHLVAVHSVSTEGREVARYLLSVGANPEAQNDEGLTPLVVARNPLVRSALGMSNSIVHRLRLPQTSDLQFSFDSMHGDTLKSATIEARTHSEGSRISETRKLEADEVEKLVQRLVDQSVMRKKKWMENEMNKLQLPDSRRLSTDEQAQSVERMYSQEMRTRQAHAARNSERLIGELVPRRYLEASELVECGVRLCNTSMESKRQHLETLRDRYAPAEEKRRLTPTQMADSATRMHDAAVAHREKSISRLSDQYLSPVRNRFNNSRRLSGEEVRESGERLTKRKS